MIFDLFYCVYCFLKNFHLQRNKNATNQQYEIFKDPCMAKSIVWPFKEKLTSHENNEVYRHVETEKIPNLHKCHMIRSQLCKHNWSQWKQKIVAIFKMSCINQWAIQAYLRLLLSSNLWRFNKNFFVSSCHLLHNTLQWRCKPFKEKKTMKKAYDNVWFK